MKWEELDFIYWFIWDYFSNIYNYATGQISKAHHPPSPEHRLSDAVAWIGSPDSRNAIPDRRRSTMPDTDNCHRRGWSRAFPSLLDIRWWNDRGRPIPFPFRQPFIQRVHQPRIRRQFPGNLQLPYRDCRDRLPFRFGYFARHDQAALERIR
jgi:hypothetical protein